MAPVYSIFESLPVELLTMIFEHLSPGDIASLSSSSRWFGPVAEPFMYRSFPGSRRETSKLRAFVHKLVERPDFAQLVTSLDLTQEEDPTRPERVPGYLRPGNVEWFEDENWVIPALAKLGFPVEEFQFDDQTVDWEASDFEFEDVPRFYWTPPKEGRIPITYHVNLLLALCPNVTTLRMDSDLCPALPGSSFNIKTVEAAIVDWSRLYHSVGHALRAIREIEVVGRPGMVLKHFWRERADNILDRTKYEEDEFDKWTLDMMNNEDDGIEYGFRIAFDSVDPLQLFHLPALESLRLVGNLDVTEPLPEDREKKAPRLTSLSLIDCSLDDPSATQRLIESCGALQSFECRVRTELNRYEVDKPFALGLYDALESSWKSLRRLTITLDASLASEYEAPPIDSGTWWDHPPSTTTSRMENLQELELDYAIMMDREFVDEDEDPPFRLSSALPRSIRKLTIHEFPRDDGFVSEEWVDFASATTMLYTLLVDMPMSFPELHTVIIHVSLNGERAGRGKWKDDAAKVEELKHAFAEAGCELQIH